MSVSWATIAVSLGRALLSYLKKPSTYLKAKEYLKQQKEKEKEDEKNQRIIDDINSGK